MSREWKKGSCQEECQMHQYQERDGEEDRNQVEILL